MSNDDMTWGGGGLKKENYDERGGGGGAKICFFLRTPFLESGGGGGGGGVKICLFLMTSFLDSPLYEIKLSFHQYKLSISFSETKSSHFDEDIPLPHYTDRFPHGGMDYQIFVRK